MLVVEFRVDSPILQDALAGAPETTITLEELYQTEDGIVLQFWAAGGSVSTFEEHLATDPTVTNADRLTETETRQLYRVTFTDDGARVATFPTWSELDVSFLAATASHEGWDVRLRLPDRAALQSYVEICAERDLGFRLQSIYEESDATTGAGERLTEVQREALVAARESGYFDVPRQASLADVADQFDVSPQAMSERIRRGTATLVDNTLLTRNA